MEDLKLLDPGSALARALQRGRERYNARVTMARRQGRRLDPVAVAMFLAEDAAPVVDAVERVAAVRTDAVLETLFDLALELLPREIVGSGSRYPVVVEAWRTLLPLLARRVAEEPQRVVASVTNAVFNLSLEPAARPRDWLAAMSDLGPRCGSVAELLTLGQVLGWRAGLAHYRESALQAWESLPDGLACAVFGATDRARLRALLAHPWSQPSAPGQPAALTVVARVGGFRGFGGPFLRPPRIWSAQERIWATDGERTFSLHADCFGQTLRPAAEAPGDERRGGLARLEPDGRLQFEGLTAKLPVLAGASGFAVAGATVAVSLPCSHRLLLVARTGGEA